MQSDPALTANRLLAALPPAVLERLEPDLEPVVLEAGEVLARRDAPQEWVTFPGSGLASRLVVLGDGHRVEVLSLGREGLTGILVGIGDARGPFEVIVQVPGHAWRMARPVFLRHLEAEERFRDLVLRYTAVALAQAARQVACNRHHVVQKRLARWLLMAADCSGQDAFALTHECLSDLLGTRRASVTIAAEALREAGLLAYRRGVLRILDRQGLEQASCICWQEDLEEYQRLIGIPMRDDVVAPVRELALPQLA